MNRRTQAHATFTVLALAALLSACGGAGDDSATPTASAGVARIQRGGGGGGGTPVVGTNPLPTTAPAPDVLIRESFGAGPDIVRPKGGKGELAPSFVHTTINSFWVEWPGSKNTQWITADGDQTWKFCGTNPTPTELPSPLQDLTPGTAGCASSEWFDLISITQHPTALLPFAAPATAWTYSMEGHPSVVGNSYVAIGLTSSGATMGNLRTVGQVWLSIRYETPLIPGMLIYELRLNGSTGPLLASGLTDDITFNELVIGYDPVAQVLTARVNGVSLGNFPIALAAPKYLAFEGVGLMDNLLVRKANTGAQ